MHKDEKTSTGVRDIDTLRIYRRYAGSVGKMVSVLFRGIGFYNDTGTSSAGEFEEIDGELKDGAAVLSYYTVFGISFSGNALWR